MNILVVSLPDLKKINPQRPHHILRHLAKYHNISIIGVNAWWLNEIEDPLINECFSGVPYYYLSDKKISPILQELQILSKYRSLIKEVGSFDVCINFHSILAGSILSRHLDIPVILDICDDIVDWISNSPKIPSLTRPFIGPLAGLLLRRNINSASGITYSIDSLKQKYYFPDHKSYLIPNGVDTEVFQKKRTPLKNQLGLLNQDVVLGFVGFLGSWVNFDPVFEAIAKLKDYHSVSMLIVGDGPELGHWMNRARDMSVNDNVIFTGNVNYQDVPDYISCIDICLLPFDMSMVSQNALPLKLFEYMACEVPVISTPIPGVQNAVANRVHYYSNSNDLQECITHLMRDEALYSKATNEGRKFVDQYFSWNTIFSQFDDILFETAGGEKV